MIIPSGAIRKNSIINALLSVGAVSQSSARTLNEAGVIKGLGIKFDQLVERGVIVPCGDGKYYVDESRM